MIELLLHWFLVFVYLVAGILCFGGLAIAASSLYTRTQNDRMGRRR
jgi:hypothetical protein